MPQARIGEIDVIDGLDSTDGFSALSANMGRVLNEKIEDLADQIPTLTPATDAVIDALFN